MLAVAWKDNRQHCFCTDVRSRAIVRCHDAELGRLSPASSSERAQRYLNAVGGQAVDTVVAWCS